MEWKNLSNESKSVIEWVENPFTHKREIISIEIGGYFNPIREVNIQITEELFKEILSWVQYDKEITYELNGSKLTFKLSDDSKVKLH